MKKILLIFALILTLCVACFAFTACGDDTQSDPGDNSGDSGTKPEPEKDEISFKTLEVNGTNVYGRVSKDKEIFEFTNEIKVSGNAKYVVALDALGMQTVATKTVSLNEGDNTFYVIEMVDDEATEVYTVVIHRNEVCEVSFVAEDVIAAETQYIEEGFFATAPTTNVTTRLGYEFLGWDFDFTKPITGDVVVKAKIELKDEMKNFEFTSTTTTCHITSLMDKTVTEIAIPDYVTSIGNLAFSYCTGLTSVTIGNSVKSIGESAFSCCTSLTSVTIPDSVTSIGEDAFSGCTSLKSVTIPDSVTSIGNYAFAYCDNLTSVTIGNSVTSIGSSAFYGCNKLVEVIDLSSLNITKGSSSNGRVGYYAKEVHKGESKIVNYNDYLFYTYNGVNYLLGYVGEDTALVLPESYKGENYKINNYAFYNRKDITSVTIPDSVTSIGNYAFYSCDSLTSVYITDITAWCNISFVTSSSNPLSYAKNLYLNGELVTELVIPEGVTEIPTCAFKGQSSIKTVVIPDSVTSIGSSAFSGCTGLTSITIPDSVTSIGRSAFEGCTGLTSVVISDSVTSIGEYAFSGCSGLTSVTIPDSVTSIGYSAFSGCTGLEEIYFNATAMDDLSSYNYVFYNAGINGDGIKVVIGKNVTKIPAYLFYPNSDSSYSPKIVSVEFEEGSACKSIGEGAFSRCTGLTSVTIPDSVTSIGRSAFEGCTGLTSVTIPDSVTSIGYSAFGGCTRLTIYCKAASQPSGWNSYWNLSGRPVVWGYKG